MTSGSIDKREAILSRLYAVLQTLEGSGSGFVKTVVRNRGELRDVERPAVEMWDSDEVADPDFFNKGRKRPPYAPAIMLMRPKIYVLLSTLEYTEIAEELNTLRARLLNAVLMDDELRGMCEDIYLEEMSTDLDRGRSQKGEMGLIIVFQYVLRPDYL